MPECCKPLENSRTYPATTTVITTEEGTCAVRAAILTTLTRCDSVDSVDCSSTLAARNAISRALSGLVLWQMRNTSSGAVSVQHPVSHVQENQKAKISSPQPPAPNAQPPSSYTPRHLAERIRAEQAALEARGVRTASARRSRPSLPTQRLNGY